MFFYVGMSKRWSSYKTNVHPRIDRSKSLFSARKQQYVVIREINMYATKLYHSCILKLCRDEGDIARSSKISKFANKLLNPSNSAGQSC